MAKIKLEIDEANTRFCVAGGHDTVQIKSDIEVRKDKKGFFVTLYLGLSQWYEIKLTADQEERLKRLLVGSAQDEK